MKFEIIVIVVILAYQYFTRPNVNDLIKYYTENPTDDIIFNIPIYLYTHDFQLPDIVEALQIQITSELAKIQFDEIVNIKFDVKYGDANSIWPNITSISKFDENSHYVEFRLRDVELLYNYPMERWSEFIFTEQTLFSNDFPYFLTQTLLFQIFKDEIDRFKISNFINNETGVYYDGDLYERDSLKLNIINGDNKLDLETIRRSFTDLQKLYSNISFKSDEYDFNILIDTTLDSPNTIEVQTDEDLDYSQLLYDIKDPLFTNLGFIKNPQVIPLRVDMELRFQILNNLLKFIRLINVNKSKFTDLQILQFFKTRSEILRIVREDYDWAELFQMSKKLVKQVV